jgi:hypothetical protein
MKLSKKLAKKFETEFEKVFEKEKAEKDFLKQGDFQSCRDRAAAGIIKAIEPIITDLGYCIAVHREKEHGDDTLGEQVILLEDGADPEMGTMSWWND